MPRYDFKCDSCDSIQTDVVLRITHKPEDRPLCCNENMKTYITVPPMVHWNGFHFKPYVPVSVKNPPTLMNAKQEKEFLLKNDLVISHDMGPPPTKKEQMEYHREKVMPSVEKVSASDEIRKQLDIV